MLKTNLSLLAGSAILFFASVAVASMHFDGAPKRDQDTSMQRKNGDMLIFYHGRSYRAMSSRQGGVMGRSFRGGGIRGGK